MAANTTQQPNILFFLPDQWRPDFLSFAGAVPVRTPTVDRLAASGTVFTRATTPSPVCAPARACLAVGMSYRRNPVPNNKADSPIDRPTVYSRLRDVGYQVGSVGKLDLHKNNSRVIATVEPLLRQTRSKGVSLHVGWKFQGVSSVASDRNPAARGLS